MRIDKYYDGREYENFSQHQREGKSKLIRELKLKGKLFLIYGAEKGNLS